MTSPLDINDFIYNTGTLSIEPGDTSAVFDGAGLSAVAKGGDYLFAGGALAVIQTVVDDGHVELFTEWAGGNVSAGPYLILKASLLRYHTALIGYDAARLLALLDGTNVWYFVEGDEPDPSLGEDGNKALKANTAPWKVWSKVSGVWELQPGSPGAQGNPGADGALWVVQESEPSADYPSGSLWLDADSADLDVYQLGGSPPAWEDSGVNLKGTQGNPGPGVPAGGSPGQVLAKVSASDNDTEWIDPPASGGDVAGDTHAAASKTTPDDADELPLVDSAASNVLKKLTWSNLKAAITAVFGTAATKDVGTSANNVPQLDTAGKLLNAVMGASSIGASGYYTLPGGLIFQWGTTPTPTSGASSTTFPVAFPTACAAVMLTVDGFNAAGMATVMVNARSTTGFTAVHRFSNGAVLDSGSIAKYIAIGY